MIEWDMTTQTTANEWVTIVTNHHFDMDLVEVCWVTTVTIVTNQY